MAKPAIDLDAAAWHGLFSLTHRAADDRAVLDAELARWSASRGAADAALYAAGADGYRRLAMVGTTPFPERLGARLPGGWFAVELPEALLLTTVELASAADPQLLLLAAGARIVELKQLIQEQHFQARFRGVELQALYDVGLAIASTLDLAALGEEVLLRAISLLDARRGALYLIEDGHYRLQSQLGAGARRELAADDPAIQALLAGEEDGGELLSGARHVLAVPVEIEGQPRGLLLVGDKESRHGVGPFPPTDRRTLSLFANQAAIALENAKLHRLSLEKERLEREMELAAEIQQQILPKMMPDITGFEVHGWNRPARQVGGDYFDLRGLGDGRWSLVVGDVTGKGLPAALMVSTLHSALRLLPDSMPVGPALIERLNRHIHEASSSNKFITLLLAELNSETAEVSYLNAGHNPGVLIRRRGEVEELPAGGLPLGLMPQARYGARRVSLERGDLLCLYSDGITECESPAEEEYGLERLVALLEKRRDEPLEEIVAAIDLETTTFASGLPQGDDQTVVLLRRS
ncbi:MAG: GAF domain-containing protein [Acidobacteria bacterium]|nr:MAG: GAF domain-containing protein [Acidobacteriota bacterium]